MRSSIKRYPEKICGSVPDRKGVAVYGPDPGDQVHVTWHATLERENRDPREV